MADSHGLSWASVQRGFSKPLSVGLRTQPWPNSTAAGYLVLLPRVGAVSMAPRTGNEPYLHHAGKPNRVEPRVKAMDLVLAMPVYV